MKAIDAPHYLLEVALRRDQVPSYAGYPFALAAVRGLRSLKFPPGVTFLIGENGSGKSTLIEAIGIAWGFNPEGGSKGFRFESRASHSVLHQFLTLVRSPQRPRDGFFFRAESYFNLATELERLDSNAGLIRPPPPLTQAYGGRSLHEQSHGESFFALLMERFQGQGLYILDEPEAALSPMRQMAALVRIHQLVSERSQFIIATHSPILMAYPGATIYALGDKVIRRIAYSDTEHFAVTRAFMGDHRRMLRELGIE